MLSKTVGDNVARLRKALKMSQEKLAFESNLSVRIIRLCEHGRANLTLDSLESIAKTLKVNPVKLLEEK